MTGATGSISVRAQWHSATSTEPSGSMWSDCARASISRAREAGNRARASVSSSGDMSTPIRASASGKRRWQISSSGPEPQARSSTLPWTSGSTASASHS